MYTFILTSCHFKLLITNHAGRFLRICRARFLHLSTPCKSFPCMIFLWSQWLVHTEKKIYEVLREMSVRPRDQREKCVFLQAPWYIWPYSLFVGFHYHPNDFSSKIGTLGPSGNTAPRMFPRLGEEEKVVTIWSTGNMTKLEWSLTLWFHFTILFINFN